MKGALAVKGYGRCPILLVLFTLLSIACTALTVIGCLNFRSNLDLLVYMGIVSGLLSAGSLIIWVTCQIETADDVIYYEDMKNPHFISDYDTSEISDISADEQYSTAIHGGRIKENMLLLSTASLTSNEEVEQSKHQRSELLSQILNVSFVEDMAIAVELTELKDEDDKTRPSVIQLTPELIHDTNDIVTPFTLPSSDITFSSKNNKDGIETFPGKLSQPKGLFSRHTKIFPVRKEAANDNFHDKTLSTVDKSDQDSIEELEKGSKHDIFDTNRSTANDSQARGPSVSPERGIFLRYPFIAARNDNVKINKVLPPIQRHNQLPPLWSKMQ